MIESCQQFAKKTSELRSVPVAPRAGSALLGSSPESSLRRKMQNRAEWVTAIPFMSQKVKSPPILNERANHLKIIAYTKPNQVSCQEG
jgi:hypothetical protein